MRVLSSATLISAAVLSGAGLAGCGSAPVAAADPPPTSTAPAATPAATAPTAAAPSTTPAPPDPGNSTSAISYDSQAKLTAADALRLVRACAKRTSDYARCQSEPYVTRTELHAGTSFTWGAGLGQVRVRAGRRTFRLDSHSYSGAHFVVQRRASGAIVRSCSGSVRECDSGTW